MPLHLQGAHLRPNPWLDVTIRHWISYLTSKVPQISLHLGLRLRVLQQHGSLLLRAVSRCNASIRSPVAAEKELERRQKEEAKLNDERRKMVWRSDSMKAGITLGPTVSFRTKAQSALD